LMGFKERAMRDRRYEEEELKRCTFKPKTRWHIVKERQNMTSASPNDMLWDGDSDDMAGMPPGETAIPKKVGRSSPEALSPSAGFVNSDNAIHTDVKLVSNDKFQEESGKNKSVPTVVRSNYVGSITPSTPEVSFAVALL
jgi:hypothetical protein